MDAYWPVLARRAYAEAKGVGEVISMDIERETIWKTSSRIALWLRLSYFGMFMLAYFLGQLLVIQWYAAPPETSPLGHVYRSPEFAMAGLLLLVIATTTLALRLALPLGLWKTLTLPWPGTPKQKFVRTMWMAIYIVILALSGAFVFERKIPDHAPILTTLMVVFLVVLWAVHARQTYRSWKHGEDHADSAS